MKDIMPTRWLCKRYSAFLAAYSENALPPKAAARIEAHLAACSACRDDVRALRQVSGVLTARKPSVLEPSAEVWQRVHARIAPDARAGARPVWRLPVLTSAAGLAAAAALFCVFVRPWDASSSSGLSASAAWGDRKPSAPAAPMTRTDKERARADIAAAAASRAAMPNAAAEIALSARPEP